MFIVALFVIAKAWMNRCDIHTYVHTHAHAHIHTHNKILSNYKN